MARVSSGSSFYRIVFSFVALGFIAVALIVLLRGAQTSLDLRGKAADPVYQCLNWAPYSYRGSDSLPVTYVSGQAGIYVIGTRRTGLTPPSISTNSVLTLPSGIKTFKFEMAIRLTPSPTPTPSRPPTPTPTRAPTFTPAPTRRTTPTPTPRVSIYPQPSGRRVNLLAPTAFISSTPTRPPTATISPTYPPTPTNRPPVQQVNVVFTLRNGERYSSTVMVGADGLPRAYTAALPTYEMGITNIAFQFPQLAIPGVVELRTATVDCTPNNQSPTPTPAGGFSNLSSQLAFDRAAFNFTYATQVDPPTNFIVDMSTVPDMSTDVYLSFAQGTTSPLIRNSPQLSWDKYRRGARLYWRIKAVVGNNLVVLSPIQSGCVEYCGTVTPTFTPPPVWTPTPIACITIGYACNGSIPCCNSGVCAQGYCRAAPTPWLTPTFTPTPPMTASSTPTPR